MNIGTRFCGLAFVILAPSAVQAQDTSEAGGRSDTADTTSVQAQPAPAIPQQPSPPPPPPPPPRASAALNQGTVTIRAEGGARLRIVRDGGIVGRTPEQVKQRFGTKRFYQVRDTNDVTLCSDTIPILTPYESVEVVCDTKSGHMKPDTTSKP